MRKIAVLVFLWAFAGATFAAAPTASSGEAMLTATRAEKVLESMFTIFEHSMRQGMVASLQGQTLNAEACAASLDQMPVVTQKSMTESQALTGPMVERFKPNQPKVMADIQAAK